MISFVFADLITLPLLLIYRRYYGGRLTLKLLVLFWATMSAAGLVVEELFRAAGLLPSKRPPLPVPVSFHFDATLALNTVFLCFAAGLWWLSRNQRRLGGGAGFVLDPVCGMQVDPANAATRVTYRGAQLVFCSDRCRQRFEEHPERYLGGTGEGPAGAHTHRR